MIFSASSGEVEELLLDNVHLRKFGAGFHSAPHLHPTVEILQCLSGAFYGEIRGVQADVQAGEYLAVFPNVPHSITVDPRGDCRILQIHLHCSESQESENISALCNPFFTEQNMQKVRFLKAGCSTQLSACLSGILEEAAAKAPGGKEMLSAYVRQMMILMSRDLRKQDAGWDGKCTYVTRAVQYIGKHYMEKLTVTEVAAAAGVSSRYLNRLFQEHLGLSLSAYTADVRLSRAIDYKLFHPAYPLSQLALDVGFGSQQHFCRIFKEKMGISPNKYFIKMASSMK